MQFQPLYKQFWVTLLPDQDIAKVVNKSNEIFFAVSLGSIIMNRSADKGFIEKVHIKLNKTLLRVQEF